MQACCTLTSPVTLLHDLMTRWPPLPPRSTGASRNASRMRCLHCCRMDLLSPAHVGIQTQVLEEQLVRTWCSCRLTVPAIHVLALLP